MKLNDKYTQQSGSVYLTGMQALVRLPMEQMRRDQLAGLNTATFISGYEGSPLGAYDLTLSRAAGLLKEHRIHFVPGVNEDIAATQRFWGSVNILSTAFTSDKGPGGRSHGTNGNTPIAIPASTVALPTASRRSAPVRPGPTMSRTMLAMAATWPWR